MKSAASCLCISQSSKVTDWLGRNPHRNCWPCTSGWTSTIDVQIFSQWRNPGQWDGFSLTKTLLWCKNLHSEGWSSARSAWSTVTNARMEKSQPLKLFQQEYDGKSDGSCRTEITLQEYSDMWGTTDRVWSASSWFGSLDSESSPISILRTRKGVLRYKKAFSPCIGVFKGRSENWQQLVELSETQQASLGFRLQRRGGKSNWDL